MLSENENKKDNNVQYYTPKKPIPSVSTMPKLVAPLKSVLKTPSTKAAFLQRSNTKPR